MAILEVKVPSIGDYKDVPVIDVLVKPGDDVAPDDPLVTLESDKATMDVPSPSAGKVRELRVKAGDRVSEGSVVLTLDAAGAGQDAPAGKPAPERGGNGAEARTGGAGAEARAGVGGAEARTGAGDARDGASDAARAVAAEPPEGKDPAPRAGAGDDEVPTLQRTGRAAARAPSPAGGEGAPARAEPPRTVQPAGAKTVEVKVPSIGDYHDVPVIDVLVKAGEEVVAEAPLVTLESDKATMDVPSPAAGKLREVRAKVGDRVSEGSIVAILEVSGAPAADQAASAREPVEGRDPTPERPASSVPAGPPAAARPDRKPDDARARATEAAPPPRPPAAEPAPRTAPAAEAPPPSGRVAHASPSVRKLARELGVDLSRVEGTGPKGRILQPDVQGFVKDALARADRAPAAGGGLGLDLPAWPRVDFEKFGAVERQPLSRIRKLSKGNLARNWVMIPHVTQHDEADVTELEELRKRLNEEHARTGPKVTLLAFLVKAAVAALKRFPEVNASLDGDELVLKRYFHIGFAADTPHGLVVPVVRDADRKGVLEIASELAALAAKARDGKLALADMQGGSFSISSLGGIGGTAFTPIINAPEVAILGVSKSQTKPVWDGERFVPRLVLPLSLSYDHRVIDGALAARFTTFLAGVLGDLRRALL